MYKQLNEFDGLKYKLYIVKKSIKFILRCKIDNGSGTPAVDHFNSKAKTYRIYSLIVTYDSKGNKTDEQIAQAKQQDLLVRSYIRYTDAKQLVKNLLQRIIQVQMYLAAAVQVLIRLKAL